MDLPKVNSEDLSQSTTGFCIYIDTLIEGTVAIERTTAGHPFVYPTREAAERQIAEDVMGRILEFLAGERDFEDAMTIEEYVDEVDVLPDGSTADKSENPFGKNNE